MKILYVSHDLLSASLVLELQKEKNEVILFEKDPMKTLEGSITRQPFGKLKEYILRLDKKKDLIIFEDVRFGNRPKQLREMGYSVIGGEERTDKMELNRVIGNKLAEQAGLLVPKIKEVKGLQEAQDFLKSDGKRWVLKQQGALDSIKGLNFVAKMDDSSDLILYIDWLKERWVEGLKQEFILQEYVEGREFACGAYWNGKEFMKDMDGDELVEENWEHKSLMPGNLGEATGEMYTVQRMRKGKDSKIFKETLDKIRPMLLKLDYRGDIDINTKVNEKGVFFLEFTNRFGSPATSGQLAMHKTEWGEFLKACADGEQTNFKYDPRFTIVAVLFTKPFPSGINDKIKKLIEGKYQKTPPKDMEEQQELLETRLADSEGLPIIFNDLTKEDMKNIHADYSYYSDLPRVSNSAGYVLSVTGQGETVKKAGEEVKKLLKKIIVAKGFYRNDFGYNYFESKKDLEKWGFLEESFEPNPKEDYEAMQSKMKSEYEEKIKSYEEKVKELEQSSKNYREETDAKLSELQSQYDDNLKVFKKTVKEIIYEN